MARKPRMVEPKTNLPLAQRHVNMSNALVRGSHRLTLGEKRMIAAGIASTDSKSAHLFNQSMMAGGWIIRITAREYAETMKIDERTAYEQLRDSAKTLVKKQWKVVDGRSVALYNWLAKCEYHEGEGWVELEFTHHTGKHLLALKGSFTKYRLEQAAALRSVHSWRLFECLKSWNSTGLWRPTIEDFWECMDAPESCRKDFKDLRRRIIEPAVHELRQKDNLLIDWEPVKAGRKVTGLVFKFKPNPQRSLEL